MSQAVPASSPVVHAVRADHPPVERGALLGVALVTLALHVVTAHSYGYFRDEFYYIACGRRLDWGYVDHPPVIALVAAFAERVLGGSLVAIRLLPALSHAVLVFVTGLMAQRFGGARFAQVTAALAAMIGLVFLAAATALTMNPFDQLLWTLCMFVLVDAFAAHRSPNWLAFGALAGVGLMNKHSLAFYLAAATVGLLISPQRTLLRTRGPWLAALVAAVIASPNIVWEVRHHWPTLEFLHNAAVRKNYSGSPAEFLVAQALIIHPVNVVLVAFGLAFLLGTRDGARYRAIGWSFVAVFVLLFALKSKHYYVAPAYPAVLAAGARGLERISARGAARVLRPAFVTLLLVLGAVLAPFVVPLLPPPVFVRYAATIGTHEPQSERHRPAKLPQQYADMFGWEELAAAVARVYHRLPPAERSKCILFASNYGEAGALEWFGPKYGLPKVASGHNSYFLWGPPDTAADIVITVGEDSVDVAKSLSSVERAGVFSHEWNMPYESDLPILIGRRLRMPWREIWPNTKKYI